MDDSIKLTKDVLVAYTSAFNSFNDKHSANIVADIEKTFTDSADKATNFTCF